jgi:hypothetical protein
MRGLHRGATTPRRAATSWQTVYPDVNKDKLALIVRRWTMRYDIPTQWERQGMILERMKTEKGSSVAGDPCIVWDDDIPGWRMVLFFSPPGHAQAICPSRENIGPGHWQFLGPLLFSNPEALLGGRTHKPFVVMDALQPNRAAKVDGRFWLVTVSYIGYNKIIQRAHAEKLAGPWTLETTTLIDRGAENDFDAKHCDAVTGYYFADRQEFLYFYMGYPLQPQAREFSPRGSAQGVAVQGIGDSHARKLGVILPPCQQAGHWSSGWVGGLQLIPGRSHRWLAVINASPTAPLGGDQAVHREEPPPSLGGFAYCDDEYPVRGWTWCPDPIEWVDDIPADAIAQGEGVNLWRQNLLCLPDGRMALYYNSGSYGKEQLYMKLSTLPQ